MMKSTFKQLGPRLTFLLLTSKKNYGNNHGQLQYINFKLNTSHFYTCRLIFRRRIIVNVLNIQLALQAYLESE